MVTPCNDGKPGYTIPLSLSDALMTIQISLPTSAELETLPIVDITPEGVWVPSEYNDGHPGLSFGDSCFLAQTSQTTPSIPITKQEDADVFHDAIGEDSPDTGPPTFHDVSGDNPFLDGGHYFDPADSTFDHDHPGRAFHLTLDGSIKIPSESVDHFLMTLSHEELRGNNNVFDSLTYISRAAIIDRAKDYVEYLGYRPVNIIRKTLENTSQLAHAILQFPMRRHVKARFPWLNCNHYEKPLQLTRISPTFGRSGERRALRYSMA
jgi:hypothetical protein